MAPLLHTGTTSELSRRIFGMQIIGVIATTRRTMPRIGNRRRVGRPLGRAWLIQRFIDLEAARAILANAIEGFALKPIKWADEVGKMKS